MSNDATGGGRQVPRRSVLRASLGVGVGSALLGSRLFDLADAATPASVGPGTRPFPELAAGTDTIPQIEHIVVLMMENHSFDNYFGLLGRGDGFPLDRHGRPRAANPDANDNLVHAFHMPSTCQLANAPSQSWNATHISMNGRRNDGFVRASGPVAMGYWTPRDLPFYSAMARTFVLCDRWFASAPAQTFPNRRFLLAATASGHVRDDLDVQIGPPNGTILEQLDQHGITWRNYYVLLATTQLFPNSTRAHPENVVKIDQFYRDAATGALPAFSLVDPAPFNDSEENPQDIRKGEAFAASVINAVLESPTWPKTLLIWCYDEHGGYYDHVPSPRAVAPDATPPMIMTPPDEPGGYDRYGVRVPAVVVSPRAKRDHVSRTVYDHTSILKTIEVKWNLPALTARDAHANSLLDCLDLKGKPVFLRPPKLPKPALEVNPAACAPIGPDAIPPPGAVTRA
jgi:phospholipase C